MKHQHKASLHLGPVVVAALALLAVLAVGCDMHGLSADRSGDSLAVANARCPIMGRTLDPAKVPARLTREYQGKTVGFCCGGCPGAWDRLSDEQKQAKLAKVSG